MWKLYDDLIKSIPADITVDDYNVARNWTLICAGGNIGVSLTVPDSGMPRSHPGPVAGMSLRDAAALAKSWNFTEASLGVAALNAYYSTWDKAAAFPGFVRPASAGDDLASRTEKNAFFAFADELAGKKVAVIGHFPHIEKAVAPICELSILERCPSPGDYPDSACEYILPEQDYVFITGMTLINKTLPRLLQICQKPKVSLVGPSAPLSPVLWNYGADNISGFVCTEPERMDAIVRMGQQQEIFKSGRMVSINRK